MEKTIFNKPAKKGSPAEATEHIPTFKAKSSEGGIVSGKKVSLDKIRED